MENYGSFLKTKKKINLIEFPWWATETCSVKAGTLEIQVRTGIWGTGSWYSGFSQM